MSNEDRTKAFAKSSSVQAQTRTQALAEFYSAPETALFNQIVIAYIRDCSTATMERDRWAGGGIPFIKISRAVKYRKADVLAWLEQYQPQQSTSVS
jgi:hypothetical protein